MSPAIDDEESGHVYPPDDRINWQYGDLNAVVYDHEDGVVVYFYNGNTWLGMHINQGIVDNADLSQEHDIPVLDVDHAGCRIAFYILDSEEYQINIWSFEGKIYELIEDTIDFENATMRYYDPNEYVKTSQICLPCIQITFYQIIEHLYGAAHFAFSRVADILEQNGRCQVMK